MNVTKPSRELMAQRRTLTRRALIVGGAQATILSAIGLQMSRMQLRDADQYRMLAEKNRISLQLIGLTCAPSSLQFCAESLGLNLWR